LTLGIVSVSLEIKFFFQKPHKQAHNAVGERIIGAIVKRSGSILGRTSKAVIGGGEHELTELIDLEVGIIRCIILAYYVCSVRQITTDIVLSHKINKVISVNLSH